MGVIYVKGHGWNELRQKLYDTGHDVFHAQDTVVAKVGATARPKAFEIEDQILENKHGTLHRKTGINKKGEHFDKTYRSIWNAKGKYWQSQAKGHQKLMQFNYENTAAKYKRGPNAGRLKPGALSEVSFFSRVANLWEYDTKPYSRRSPFFGARGSTGIWKTGQIRKGRKYFMSRIYPVVDHSIPEAIKKTEEKIFTREKGYE